MGMARRSKRRDTTNGSGEVLSLQKSASAARSEVGDRLFLIAFRLPQKPKQQTATKWRRADRKRKLFSPFRFDLKWMRSRPERARERETRNGAKEKKKKQRKRSIFFSLSFPCRYCGAFVFHSAPNSPLQRNAATEPLPPPQEMPPSELGAA